MVFFNSLDGRRPANLCIREHDWSCMRIALNCCMSAVELDDMLHLHVFELKASVLANSIWLS
jgi:hypothetical protein